MQLTSPKVVVSAAEILKNLQDPERKGPCIYRGVTIQGALDLRHLVIDWPFELSGCEILDDVDLRYAEFRHTVDFSFSTFHKHFNSGDPTQSHTIFCKDLLANSAVFLRGATFLGTQFGGSALFTRTRFEDPGQKVVFRGCRFRKYADFDDSVFMGGADFNHVDCELSLTFIRSRFECETDRLDIWNARIGNVLDCSEMVARGGASFERARCRILRLDETRFESSVQPILLEHLSLEGALYCSKVLFEGPASFNGMQAEGAFFHGTQFHYTGDAIVDFRHTRYRVNLQLRDACFHGKVSLESVKIDSKLILDRAVFKDELILCNATIGRLELGKKVEFAPDSLDLRGCRFESIDNAKPNGLRLLQAQASRFFSRDPYIQLEKYLQSVGDDTDADDIYYRGRCALREHALQEDKPIQWSKSQRFGDLILKGLTGYGVKTERVTLPILALLLVAILVFWPEDMLKPKAATNGHTTWEEHFFDRAVYSLDLFLPVVDLGICDRWTPTNRLGQVYSVLHVIAGWLLVPLLLASSSGLVRKK